MEKNIREQAEKLISEELPDRETLKTIALMHFVAEKMGEEDVCELTRMIIDEALKHPERYIRQ